MRTQRTARIARWVMKGGVAVLVAGALLGVWAGARTPAVEAQAARTFSGNFTGSGTFSSSLCAWNTTYSGTVTLTLTFGSSGVTGTARHRGSYADRLTNGPVECGGDVNSFDVTVPVSGTAQALSWGFAHGAAGRVAVTGSLIGNAIVGRGVTTDPEYAGSAIIPFTAPEVGGSPSEPAPTAAPTSAPTTAPTVAPTAVRTAAPAVPSATAGASPSGTANASAPVGVATALPTVPTVPPPKDAGSAPRIDRAACQNFSSDPALWQALEDHLDELDQESTPVTAVKTCLAFYRSQPWAPAGGGATLVKPDEPGKETPKDGEQPPKATLQTETAFVLKAGEQGRTTTVQGAVLGKGDIVGTREQGATVNFSEGTKAELGPKSTIVMGDPADKAIIQLRGRMFMDIKSRQWHVRIPQPRGLVAVVTRGTVLTTEARDDGMVLVEVTDGSVDVTSAGQTVTVKAGSSVVVDPGAAPPVPSASTGAGTSGGTPVALYGAAAAAVVIVIAAGVFLMRRRGRG